jgi:alkanesulfonate monooxygenase SsuD/methylene tetrahydromethanopterin reductase-like flavin-dependent oxidoreductase (luciferase family)
VILQAWTKDRVNYSGTYFDIHDVPVRPKPLQSPHPPVWMAALSPESFVEAGRRGFNLLCTPVFGFAGRTAIENLAAYRTELRRAGHDPATKQIGALCMIYVSETPQQAVHDFADPVIWYYRTFSKYIAPPPGEAAIRTYEPYVGVRDLAASVTWEQLQQSGAVICGTPDQCVARIRELHDTLGFTQLLCWTRLGGLDHRKVIRSMQLMQDHVMPELRGTIDADERLLAAS